MKGDVDLTKANTRVRCIRSYFDSFSGVLAFIEGKIYPCVNNLGDGYWHAQREDQTDDHVVFINGPKPEHQLFFKQHFVEEDNYDEAWDRAMGLL